MDMKPVTDASDLALSIVEIVAETVAEPILVLDTRMRVKTANQAFYRLFRVSAEESAGQLVYSLSGSRWDILDLRDLLERLLRFDTTHQDLEIEQDFPGIGSRALLLHGRRLDALPLILLVIDDITDRRDRDIRLAAIVDSSDDAIFSKTLDGTIVSWNSGAERTYGYSAHEIIGLPIGTLAPCGHEDEMSAILERIRRGEKLSHFEAKRRRKDGQIIDVSMTISPIEGRHGVITGASIIARDITELKRRQQETLAQHKLETLGRLADGIAHNFNNLLAGILASAELAATESDAGSPVVDELHKISTATIRGAEIIGQLMIYSGSESLTFEPVDMSLLIQEMLPLLQASIPKCVVLKIDLVHDLPVVQAAPQQMRQVIMNLMSNAAEAIGGRDGVIRVATALVKIGGHANVITGGQLPNGNYLLLEVSDTGCGMTSEVQAKIFDPFFTTKQSGRGIGLALIQGIIRAYGGAIGVKSLLGQGTTFQVWLPCSENRLDDHSGTATVVAEHVESHDATILVVDDEDLLRDALSKALRKKGFSVIEAGTGTAALDLIRAHNDHIHLILLDITLPGTSPLEVYEEAKRLRTDVRVIVTSAYGKEKAVSALAGKVERFIRKPCGLDQLIALIHEVLSSQQANSSA
jgi:PAS domain S-box-containing protein